MLVVTPKFAADATALQKSLVADAIKEWTSSLTGPSGQNVNLT